MEKLKLTSEQIYEMDTIFFDKKANEDSLRVAMNFHSNKHSALLKKEKAWWKDLRSIHKLHPEKTYIIDTTGVDVVIKEKIKQDKQ